MAHGEAFVEEPGPAAERFAKCVAGDARSLFPGVFAHPLYATSAEAESFGVVHFVSVQRKTAASLENFGPSVVACGCAIEEDEHLLVDFASMGLNCLSSADSPTDAASWTIEVSGTVEHAFSATLGELSEESEEHVTMGCSRGGNPAGGTAGVNARVVGAPLQTVLERLVYWMS